MSIKDLQRRVSNSVTAKVTATSGDTFMQTESKLSAGRVQHVLVALGKNPTGTQQITMISPLRMPSRLGGLVTMSIGGNWSNYFLLPQLGFSTTTRTSFYSGTVPPGARGLTVYFQTCFLHPSKRPLPVSVVRTVKYQ